MKGKWVDRAAIAAQLARAGDARPRNGGWAQGGAVRALDLAKIKSGRADCADTGP